MIDVTPRALLRKLIQKYVFTEMQCSYSQFGEDLIIYWFFDQLGISRPTYLDVGANEPRFISNTYYFYERGSTGVLVEPNPFLFRKLKAKRPNDTILNVGIGINEMSEADFYLFPNFANGLSTFSEEEAKHWERQGMKGFGKISVEKIIKMKLIPINSILATYFDKKPPNLISIDVEGLDFEILKSMDFERYKPEVICIETMKYDQNQRTYKSNSVREFMLATGYEVYADTRVNTIFARRDIFTN